MRRLDDPTWVRDQYATPDNLRARKSVFTEAEGDDPRELAFEAVAAANPTRVLEVGGGEGELAARIIGELGVELVGIEQSEAMVAIQRSSGIDVRVGDVQALPFPDEDFDLALAAWMLYHVPDLDRALGELARVLTPGGALVAVTNSITHLRELRDLAQLETPRQASTFRSENGEQALRRHFADVRRRDVYGTVTLDDDAVRRYASSVESLAPLVTMPRLAEPIRARCHATVFVAYKVALVACVS